MTTKRFQTERKKERERETERERKRDSNVKGLLSFPLWFWRGWWGGGGVGGGVVPRTTKKPKRRSGATIHSIEEEEEDEDEDDEVEDEDEEVSHRSDADVALHVQRQVVGTREGALAQLALERPVAGVFAVVARQLVRTGKLPAAVLPRALVRLLPCNRATTTKKTTFLARFLGKNGKFGNLAATLPPYHTATILIRIVFIDKKSFRFHNN